MERRLYRSQHNRVLFGVCGGLGEYFKTDPVIVRVIAVILLCFGLFPAIIAYLVMALVIPLEGSTASTTRDSLKENITDVRDTASSLGEEVRTTFEGKENKKAGATPIIESSRTSNRILYALGLFIIVLGIFILLGRVLSWFWGFFWPVLLIFAGLLVIYLVARRRRQ